MNRISAKHIGEIELEDFCPRCFWVKSRMRFKLPFQIFPGIFSSIDSYSKKVTNAHFEKHGKLPPWLGITGRPIKVPGHSKFQYLVPETETLLTGVPDEIIEKDDGSYAILDYKTAKYTNGQDRLLPMYKIQLNGYAYIAERIGIKPVTELYLIYYQPFTELTPSTVDDFILNAGFSMDFYEKVVKIELNMNRIPQLLIDAKAIYDQSKLPPSRGGCKNCNLMDDLFLVI